MSDRLISQNWPIFLFINLAHMYTYFYAYINKSLLYLIQVFFCIYESISFFLKLFQSIIGAKYAETDIKHTERKFGVYQLIKSLLAPQIRLALISESSKHKHMYWGSHNLLFVKLTLTLLIVEFLCKIFYILPT